jgi:hypothetical protein
MGAKVYVLGTRRPRGDHPGTCQSPGIPDLWIFLPPPALRDPLFSTERVLWMEVKAVGGRASFEQAEFRARCIAVGVPHVTGGLTELTAYLVAGGWLKADNVAHYRRPKEGSDATQRVP